MFTQPRTASLALIALAWAITERDTTAQDKGKTLLWNVETVFTLVGELTKEDPRDTVRKDSHARTHTLALLAGVPYTIDLESPDGDRRFDPYLRIEGADGKPLKEDDDSGGNRNARIVFTPEKDGPYRLIATSFAGGATGAYTLRVRHKTGAVFHGELTKEDPKDTVRKDSHAKVFTFKMAAKRKHVIATEGATDECDLYLRLEDAAGKELLTNDDDGGGRDARIEFTPPEAGEYRIILTTFRAGQTGRFTLKVQQQ
jgi:serine protease Do